MKNTVNKAVVVNVILTTQDNGFVPCPSFPSLLFHHNGDNSKSAEMPLDFPSLEYYYLKCALYSWWY